MPLRELPRLTLSAFPALLMPVILLYGIYGGVTTPTEAAAVAALTRCCSRRSSTARSTCASSMRSWSASARSSASVGLVIGGALIFNYIVAAREHPRPRSPTRWSASTFAARLPAVRSTLLFLLLGCILDATTIILVIVPLFIPTCRALGIDLVHFGVVIVVNCMIGLITPPYGILLFVINATTGISLRAMIGEIWPFLGVLILALLVMILVPDVVLWVPRLFGYRG